MAETVHIGEAANVAGVSVDRDGGITFRCKSANSAKI
jgi:hypothetical protein